MYGLSAKNVALSETWVLVEVTLYFKQMCSGTGIMLNSKVDVLFEITTMYIPVAMLYCVQTARNKFYTVYPTGHCCCISRVLKM